MKPQLILLLAAIGLLPAANAASVLIDFGRTDNQTSGSTVYNNLAIGTSGGTAPTGTPLALTASYQTASIAINGGTFTSTSAALNDTTGTATGWSLSVQGISQSGAAGQIGTAGSGGDYTGTLGAAASGIFATTATGDGLFINNSGVLRLTISGLDTSKTYDLSAFAGRNGSATADGGRWTLINGTALTSQAYLNSAASPTAITGATSIDSYGTNEGDLIQWLGVTPGAGGVITFDIATQNVQSNAIASLNALSIVEVPEPATALLGSLGCLLLLRRRQR